MKTLISIAAVLTFAGPAPARAADAYCEQKIRELRSAAEEAGFNFGETYQAKYLLHEDWIARDRRYLVLDSIDTKMSRQTRLNQTADELLEKILRDCF